MFFCMETWVCEYDHPDILQIHRHVSSVLWLKDILALSLQLAHFQPLKMLRTLYQKHSGCCHMHRPDRQALSTTLTAASCPASNSTNKCVDVAVQADAAWNGMQAPPQPPARARRFPGVAPTPAASAYALQSDALVAVLQQQFPLYNQDSLTDVLKVSLSAASAAHPSVRGCIL